MKPLIQEQLAASAASIESVLTTGGAHHWTPAQIEAHKARELAKAPRPSLVWKYQKQINHTFNAVFGGAMLVGAIAGSFCIAVLGMSVAATALWLFGAASWDTAGNLALTAVMLGAFTALCAGVCFTLMPLEKIKFRAPAIWRRETTDGYGWENLPDEAKRIITDTRGIRSDVSVVVHVLRQGTFTLDPILEINGHYVLVWDEHGTIVPPPA